MTAVAARLLLFDDGLDRVAERSVAIRAFAAALLGFDVGTAIFTGDLHGKPSPSRAGAGLLLFSILLLYRLPAEKARRFFVFFKKSRGASAGATVLQNRFPKITNFGRFSPGLPPRRSVPTEDPLLRRPNSVARPPVL